MTDIYAAAGARPVKSGSQDVTLEPAEEVGREQLIALVELLFFAYRDFTGEADAILAEFGFGRAHHRVLHFVNRHPGLRVADLLDILKITKQSLARVLKQLVDRGYVLQEAGPQDRRERLLYLTNKGRDLANRLLELQNARIAAALAEAGDGAASVSSRFLAGMITGGERSRIEALIFGPGRRA
ncbi:MAG TPA: MarR family transcriptional regulator [Hyphomicrobiaceae bacterium]